MGSQKLTDMELSRREWKWQSALGEIKMISEIDHQHLSNIIWFREIFNNKNKVNCDVQIELVRELQRRFDGVRLPWKPLPVPNEISFHSRDLVVRETLV